MRKITEKQLIEYFEEDLDRQRQKYKDKNNKDPKNSDLTLRIGGFEFDFREILKKLGVTEQDENRRLICPYKVNFSFITL